MIITTGQPVTAALLRAIYGTDWDTWTPTLTGGGTGLGISSGGRWRRIGEKTVIFTVNFTVTTAGSGTASITWTLPTAPSRVRRWIFVGSAEGASLPGLHAATFTGGSGTTVDRTRYGGASNLTGGGLVANMLFQFSGQYEEA